MIVFSILVLRKITGTQPMVRMIINGIVMQEYWMRLPEQSKTLRSLINLDHLRIHSNCFRTTIILILTEITLKIHHKSFKLSRSTMIASRNREN